MNRNTLAVMFALASSTAFAQGPDECAAFMDGRGLAVADEAAGAHGEQGRNRALAASVEPTITSAVWTPAAGSVPDFCRVSGYITTGDAKTGFGRVRFVVNLPSPWNGRFVMIGDGGFDGGVSGSTARLDQGYATANSDMGHNAQEFPGATFGFNNRAREIDYGWRATHVATVAAKGIIQTFYRGAPRYSYWEGCSTGGRQAAVAAQRFPKDYDGIVGGALFNSAIEIAMEQIWSSAVFFRDMNGDGVGFDNNITQADINALRDTVLAKCDVLENDRIRDSVVGNPQACAAVFGDADIEALGTARGLTPGQIQAIKDVYRGPHSSTGMRWHKGKPLGTEFSWGAFVVPTPANGNFPAQGGFSMELANFLWFEHDPGVPTVRRNDPSLLPEPGEWRWLDFDFDANTPTGRTVNPGTGPWTPNDGGGFMREILNGSDTNLRPFLVQRKGKYLLYHGWADGLIGGEPTVDYYEGIVRDTFGGDAARAQDQVRLFMVPGMGHCSGGIRGAAVGWDKLAPLVDWVENGKAPEQLVVRQDNATRTPEGNERILCPWPLQPTYVGPAGSGAENNPANWVAPNFECRARP
ncbi:MAG TPA: tannase/feruloyl esterase family alpha/beta hydrolase [Burkholderiales bacterium]|jgi:feruloyl esterase